MKTVTLKDIKIKELIIGYQENKAIVNVLYSILDNTDKEIFVKRVNVNSPDFEDDNKPLKKLLTYVSTSLKEAEGL